MPSDNDKTAAATAPAIHKSEDFDQLWTQYKAKCVREINKAIEHWVFLAGLMFVLGILGLIFDWTITYPCFFIGAWTLIKINQDAKGSTIAIVIDIITLVAVVIWIVDMVVTRDVRPTSYTTTLVILGSLYGLYLFNRAGAQLMVRMSRIKVRDVKGEAYPMLPEAWAFEWFASNAGRAGALVPVKHLPAFRGDLSSRLRATAQVSCDSCLGEISKPQDKTANFEPCGSCNQGDIALVLYNTSMPYAPELEEPQPEEPKVPCEKCGKMILQATAEKNKGLCMPCKQGTRK